VRELATRERIGRLLQRLGAAARTATRVYLTGGATAVLTGWRDATVDVDVKLLPETDEVLRAIAELKNELAINVELAAPDHFIPELPGWQERSVFIERIGPVSFYHYDPYGQALSKLERGHAKDRDDVVAMARRGMIEAELLLRLFEKIEPELYRYPAIDPPSFRSAVESFLRQWPAAGS
jgi:hypothetical protein